MDEMRQRLRAAVRRLRRDRPAHAASVHLRAGRISPARAADRKLRANARWQRELTEAGFEFDGESVIDRFDARELLNYSAASDQGQALSEWVNRRVGRLLE